MRSHMARTSETCAWPSLRRNPAIPHIVLGMLPFPPDYLPSDERDVTGAQERSWILPIDLISSAPIPRNRVRQSILACKRPTPRLVVYLGSGFRHESARDGSCYRRAV